MFKLIRSFQSIALEHPFRDFPVGRSVNFDSEPTADVHTPFSTLNRAGKLYLSGHPDHRERGVPLPKPQGMPKTPHPKSREDIRTEMDWATLGFPGS